MTIIFPPSTCAVEELSSNTREAAMELALGDVLGQKGKNNPFLESQHE
jgi:hypothetical protein